MYVQRIEFVYPLSYFLVQSKSFNYLHLKLEIIHDLQYFSTVLIALFDRIANPDGTHALVPEIGELFVKDKKQFDKKAAEHTKKNAMKR